MRIRFLTFAVLLACVPAADAQLQVPRLNSIFPCGGRQGSTVDCVLAGGELNDATGLYFSHAGISAQPDGPGKFKVSIGKDVPVGPFDVAMATGRAALYMGKTYTFTATPTGPGQFTVESPWD